MAERPNGLIWLDGEWHLFAQRWARCWIHAVSRDLLHWTELEPGLWESDAFGTGVQSGTIVLDRENASGLSPDPSRPPLGAFWSGFDNKSQCVSFSLDPGRTWKPYAKNPIFVHPERDPKVFWHGPSGKWVMILHGQDKYHFFSSTNLLSWKRHEAPPVENSFECPDFFPLGDRWVLVRGDGAYSVGRFDGLRYTAETPGAAPITARTSTRRSPGRASPLPTGAGSRSPGCAKASTRACPSTSN